MLGGKNVNVLFLILMFTLRYNVIFNLNVSQLFLEAFMFNHVLTTLHFTHFLDSAVTSIGPYTEVKQHHNPSGQL